MNKFATEQLKRFNYLSSEIEAVYHEAALKFGLSDSAMLVLYAICNNGESCLLSDIIHLSGTSKQTINSALRKLEAEGIVYLEAVNGKQKRVYLTKKGWELADHTVIRLLDIENSIYDSWSPEEMALYLTLTQRYLTALKEKIKEV